jgi:hypothetical protein
VAAVYEHGGMTAEKPGGTSNIAFADPIALNHAIRDALEACEFKAKFDYSNQKGSDWPAFQASGYKTIRKFEASFIRIDIRGANEKNAIYEASTQELGEFGLRLNVVVSANSHEFGAAIQYLVSAYVRWKEMNESTSG